MIPGMGHCAGVGTAQGTAGVSPPATTNSVPLPAANQFYTALTNWVENGTAPDQIDLNSANQSASGRLCPWPKKAVYSGSGAVTAAASYTCK
jgi:feruloyl esterase